MVHEIDKSAVVTAVNEAYTQYAKTTEGQNASYIPYLKNIPPSLFGISVCMADGERIEVGDTGYRFGIESVSKVPTAILAMKQHGTQTVMKKIGADATGLPFNSIIAILLENDHPSTPLVNAGAITACSMIAPTGNSDAYSYYNGQGREELRRAACDAFDRLAATYNPIVMEGAGSIAEINLSDRDIVNMPMARHAGAAVVLVADIDRGGVFASAYGSIMLQGEADRRLIKGIIVNKFRGDMRLFDDGVKMMERICGVPVLGVVPYFDDIHIEAEDSVALAAKAKTADGDGRVQVGVVMLRHMSNFTDFDALERDPRVHLFYTCDPHEAAKADIIIVPGSKNTIADLGELRRNGMAEAVTEARRRGKTVLGICGGYQMLGAEVADPDHVEGDTERTAGLGLLPVSTRLDGTKTTRRTEFTIAACGGARMTGYEIHNGVTSPTDDRPCTPLCTKADGTTDGCIADNKCMGTYIHGILDNAAFIDFLLAPYATTERLQAESYAEFKARQYDRLAEFVRRHVDMEKVYGILGGKK